jgi:hypothetical protein
VIGTADTVAFARLLRTEWLPRMAARYPEPPDPPRSPEEEMVALLYRPERMIRRNWPGTRRTCTSTCCPVTRAPGTGGR